MVCKQCKKAFRKDLRDFDEADQFCPHCDNEYFLPSASSGGYQQAAGLGDDNSQDQAKKHESLLESRVDKISHLDPRMIRDEDLDALDEELLGFEADMTTRLG